MRPLLLCIFETFSEEVSIIDDLIGGFLLKYSVPFDNVVKMTFLFQVRIIPLLSMGKGGLYFITSTKLSPNSISSTYIKHNSVIGSEIFQSIQLLDDKSVKS